jgi:hypothetical protein
MPKGDVETFHQNGKWHNKIEGNDGVLSTYDTKEEAAMAARQRAMNDKVEHIVRNMDGTIGERNSYGNDPRNIPG